VGWLTINSHFFIKTLEGSDTVKAGLDVNLGRKLLPDASQTSGRGGKLIGRVLFQYANSSIKAVLQQVIGNASANHAAAYDKDIEMFLSQFNLPTEIISQQLTVRVSVKEQLGF
jgi:hypothetical protein